MTQKQHPTMNNNLEYIYKNTNLLNLSQTQLIDIINILKYNVQNNDINNEKNFVLLNNKIKDINLKYEDSLKQLEFYKNNYEKLRKKIFRPLTLKERIKGHII
jgi:hypothetical protein